MWHEFELIKKYIFSASCYSIFLSVNTLVLVIYKEEIKSQVFLLFFILEKKQQYCIFLFILLLKNNFFKCLIKIKWINKKCTLNQESSSALQLIWAITCLIAHSCVLFTGILVKCAKWTVIIQLLSRNAHLSRSKDNEMI